MIGLDIVIEGGEWENLAGLDALLARAAEVALLVVPNPPHQPVSVTLLLSDDRTVRELNRAWRGQDKATNVLSFPAGAPRVPEGPVELGDIALAYETVCREAAHEGKTLADHAAHLVVHGILHLLGFDHLDEHEAEAMERLEVAALARLGIADPYASSPAAEGVASHSR